MGNDSQCIFCRIVRGEIPSTKIHEDEFVVAFRDIQPAAPAHILIIPREHVASLSDLQDGHRDLAGALMLVARDIAALEGLTEDGYRVVTNTGPLGGQSVDHLHFHLLGGRELGVMG